MMPRFHVFGTGFLWAATLLVATLSTAIPSQPSHATPTPKHTLSGRQLGEYCGLAVVGTGDVTGDGIDDLAIGSPYNGAGRVQIFDGADGSVFATWGGNRTGDRFGSSLATIDLEGDGIDELVIGAPGRSTVEVYAIGSATPAVTWRGRPSSFFGASIAVGDVTGNGNPNIVVGAPHDTGRRGFVGVYSLSSAAPLRTLRGGFPFDHYGEKVAISDVSGDGIGDILVTEALWAERYIDGRVHLFEGGTGNPLGSLVASQVDLRFGESLTDVGDLDNDGHSDFVIGAPPALASLLDHLQGRVYLYSGRTLSLMHTFQGEQDFDYFGRATALASNVVDRNIKVLMIGAPSFMSTTDVNAGRVYFYNIASHAFLGSLTGTRRNGCFGSTLGVMGDIDGNQLGEVIIASPHENIQRGKIRVFGDRSQLGLP